MDLFEELKLHECTPENLKEIVYKLNMMAEVLYKQGYKIDIDTKNLYYMSKAYTLPLVSVQIYKEV